MEKSNNILKKLVFIPLTLIMFISTLTAGINSVTANAETNEVSIYSVNPKFVDAAAGMVVYGLNTEIKVKNIAYDKKVTIHYKDSAGGDWRDFKASYSYTLDGENEIWTANPVFYGDYIEYAVKYEVNGETYWDNNGGNNYKTYKYER